MSDLVLVVHDLLRWVVLVGLVAGGGWALVRAPTDRPFQDALYLAIVVTVDVQVALGLALYVLRSGWDERWFLAVVHPLTGLLALVIVHLALRGARTGHTPLDAHRTIGSGLLLALTVLAFGIPWTT